MYLSQVITIPLALCAVSYISLKYYCYFFSFNNVLKNLCISVCHGNVKSEYVCLGGRCCGKGWRLGLYAFLIGIPLLHQVWTSQTDRQIDGSLKQLRTALLLRHLSLLSISKWKPFLWFLHAKYDSFYTTNSKCWIMGKTNKQKRLLRTIVTQSGNKVSLV